MKIRHIPIHPDLAMLLTTGSKNITRRPLKPQPTFVDDMRLQFGEGEGHETSVWVEDYPCQFGEPGDLAIFYFEGNGQSFQEAKVLEKTIERLLDATEDEARKEGFETLAEMIDFWDKIYGETEFSSHFNPWVWRIRFCIF